MDRNTRIGRVVSAKMDKTVVVAVDRKSTHQLYRKAVTRTTKFKVHDENGSSGIGDLVRIQETRPLSKQKRWRLIEVIDKGAVDELLSDESGMR
ncbi:MAG: 30S ribosomal protein S17 [Dehalococcoidia bacterium]